MLGSSSSNMVGAAIGATAFPVIGPTGVVAVRQWIAAVTLLVVGRPRVRAFTGAQWRAVLLFSAAFALMNLALYGAIDRVGLGLAATLEFLGPLVVALVSSRRRLDLGCAVLAAAGVVVLTHPEPSSDYLGIGLGLLAAVFWGSYILLSRSVGRQLPGAEGSAAAAGVSGLVFLPVGILLLIHDPPTATALGCAATAGVLSSVVPFLADVLALRRVPPRFFGLFMSVNPVLAAAAGALFLGERPGAVEWSGIGAIVLANAISVAAKER
jgi:inner membrane transporter RhtA